MSDSASISSLSPELVDMITSYLESDDLSRLRLSYRSLCECSLFRFIQRYFHTRIHVLTQHSLQALLEISRHPVFGPSIRTLGVSRRFITCIGWLAPEVEGNLERVEEAQFLQDSGLITVYLTKVLANAVGCRTVMLNDV